MGHGPAFGSSYITTEFNKQYFIIRLNPWTPKGPDDVHLLFLMHCHEDIASDFTNLLYSLDFFIVHSVWTEALYFAAQTFRAGSLRCCPLSLLPDKAMGGSESIGT